MKREIYEKPQAKVVMFDVKEVYMKITLYSKNDGENIPGIPGAGHNGWDFEDE